MARSYDVAHIPTELTHDIPLPAPGGLGITIVGRADATRSFELARTMIGRSAGADLVLNDPNVSWFHAEVEPRADGIHVRDVGSSNGTYFAGARVVHAIVPSGAQITVGGTTLRLEAVPLAGEPPAPKQTSFGRMYGASAPMQNLFALLAKLARTDLPVLLEGATGTGKELAARALHDQGARAGRPFVVLDCTAIPATLAESLLFGHERGAFTGATERRPGLFELADGGTIFLDEIGELPRDLQPKLLRVLEQHEVTRLGSHERKPVDVRVISATWRDLRAMINEGVFREDLYYRVAQARVTLPSLEEHAEDIPLLVARVLENVPEGAARAIATDALRELSHRRYPGNVRELRNAVERAAALAEGGTITAPDLMFERMLTRHRDETRPAPAPDDSVTPFKEAKRSLIEEFERTYLEHLLTRAGNKLTRAASLANIERHYLRDLLRKHGLREKDEP